LQGMFVPWYFYLKLYLCSGDALHEPQQRSRMHSRSSTIDSISRRSVGANGKFVNVFKFLLTLITLDDDEEERQIEQKLNRRASVGKAVKPPRQEVHIVRVFIDIINFRN
jgi:hypothetical protein